MAITEETISDPELIALAWEMLAQEWQVLRRMCEIAACKDRLGRDTWEEAMSEVAHRLPQFLWSYDPSRGRSLRSHVIGSARWYLYKLFVGARKRETKRLDKLIVARRCDECIHDSKKELFDQLEVQSIVEGLHPFHRSILQLYYMSGLTYLEIGGVLGCSKSAARSRVKRALEAAQQRASELR